MRTWQIGIDNYGLLPLGLSPLDTVAWAKAHGADGVQFSGLPPCDMEALDASALQELGAAARDAGLYLEWGGGQHVPRDLTTWAPKPIAEINRRAASQARALGARIVRSCSGGLMRWTPDGPPTETLLRETAAALRDQRTMLEDHGVALAIETHFEFTSHELVRLMDMCDAEPGRWLGICLDTMNLLTLIEDPVDATRRLLPWIVSTHIKDGGALLDARGLTTFTAPVGRGTIPLARIVALLDTLDRPITLSIEDHGGSFFLPIFDPPFLSRFPDLTASELARVVGLAQATAALPSCRPLDRADWPACSEGRMADDISALRAITTSMEVRRDA